jgi:TolA-binding protein
MKRIAIFIALTCVLGGHAQAQTPAIAPASEPVAAASVTVAIPVPVAVPMPVPAPVPVPETTAVTAPETVPVPVPVPVFAQSQETLSARTLVRLEQLTRELSETIGRVEALEASVIAQKAENERLISLLDMARAGQAGKDASAIASESSPQPTAAAPAAAAQQVPQTAMFTAPTPPPLSPPIMLTNAQTALQSGGYQLAEANLTQLVWVHPASPEASEGRWLLGEARYVQGAWGTAAQAYVDYLKASPQGPRASEALLRLAGAFRQLGDNRQRCVALAEFKRRAPRPDATLKARADSEIARMACPAT